MHACMNRNDPVGTRPRGGWLGDMELWIEAAKKRKRRVREEEKRGGKKKKMGSWERVRRKQQAISAVRPRPRPFFFFLIPASSFERGGAGDSGRLIQLSHGRANEVLSWMRKTTLFAPKTVKTPRLIGPCRDQTGPPKLLTAGEGLAENPSYQPLCNDELALSPPYEWCKWPKRQPT